MIRQPNVRTVAGLLREAFAEEGARLGTQKSLNLAARIAGFKNWPHALKANTDQAQPCSESAASQGTAGHEDDEWFPSGSYTGALRDADAIEFSARVDAVWLAEGDIRLAARLLRTTPGSLMQSLKDAMSADTAFCGRPPSWLPEHSLSRDFSAKADEGCSFELKVRAKGSSLEVVGVVDGQEVVSMTNGTDNTWRVTGSTALPADWQKARRVQACVEAVFRKVSDLAYCA